MSDQADILVWGSLPPVRSHAAVLTHWVAAALTEAGHRPLCVLDDLSPPVADLPYQTVRRYDPALQSDDVRKLPRLYVVGGQGDSLSVLEQLDAAPGPVLVADSSLLPLALPFLERKHTARAGAHRRFSTWLTDKYGTAGHTLAEAVTLHRRHSQAIASEINAFDLLLEKATTHIALDGTTVERLKNSGLNPVYLKPPRLEFIASDPAPELLAVIAEDKSIADALEATVAASAIANRVRILFGDRYAPETSALISKAGMIAILDGHDTEFCPLAQRALDQNKPLIAAQQPWSLRAGVAALQIEPSKAATGLFHAVAALTTQPDLRARLQTLSPNRDQQKASIFADELVKHAKTAHQLPATPENDDEQRAPLSSPTAPTGVADKICALVGAVPAPPILQQQLPESELARYPKFMTPELAQRIAAFFTEPAARLVDALGFEAPLIKSENGPSEISGARPGTSWSAIAPGLRHATSAVSFASSIADMPSAPASTGTVAWNTKLPQAATLPNAPTFGCVPESGLLWQQDPIRNQVRCALLTGGAGKLKLAVRGHVSLVATDRRETLVSVPGSEATFEVEARGLFLFKAMVLPSLGTSHLTTIKELADKGLHLEWSPA